MPDQLCNSVVFIAGPTASGKSEAALTLAEEIDGEIINADAMQVYRDLRIVTARPGERDEARVRHHLYGVVDGGENFSAGRWARAAKAGVDASDQERAFAGFDRDVEKTAAEAMAMSDPLQRELALDRYRFRMLEGLALPSSSVI